MSNEIIEIGNFQRVSIRAGVVAHASYDDDSVLLYLSDQREFEIIEGKAMFYDYCDSYPFVAAQHVTYELCDILVVDTVTTDEYTGIESVVKDFFVVKTDYLQQHTGFNDEYQIRGSWKEKRDGVNLVTVLSDDKLSESYHSYDYLVIDIHRAISLAGVQPSVNKENIAFGRFEKTLGLRTHNYGSGVSPGLLNIPLVPVVGTVYLPKAGRWWRGGSYNGFTESRVDASTLYYTPDPPEGGRTWQAPLLFPDPTAQVYIQVYFAYNTSKFLNDRASLVTLPTSSLTVNEVEVIMMPWRLTYPEANHLRNPYPDFYFFPKEGVNPALTFGCVEVVEEVDLPKEAFEGTYRTTRMKALTGELTMHSTGPTPTIFDKGFSSSSQETDYDTSYMLDRHVIWDLDEEGNIISVRDWSYINVDRSSTLHNIIRKPYDEVDKFLVFTDGTNKIEKIVYYYQGSGEGVYLETFYTWNGRTVASSVFLMENYRCDEEYHFFKFMDITTGVMVADVRVTDASSSTVKWERRIYEPGEIDSPAIGYIVVWTYTSSEDNPIAIPDIRNIPPWLGEDDGKYVRRGTYSVRMGRWYEPFAADSWGAYPQPPRSPPGLDNVYYIGTFFPTPDETVISVVLVGQFHLWDDSNSFIDKDVQHCSVTSTEYGWIACMPVLWDVDFNEIEFHYGSTVLKKVGGVISGIDTLSPETVHIHNKDDVQAEYDYIPDPPP